MLWYAGPIRWTIATDEGMRTVPPGLQRSLYRPGRGQSYLDIDFDRTPVTVAWELTRACALACKHCRAMAMPRRDPRELTTAEGYRLIDQVVEIGRPILVVTGGDPLMRRDVFDLIAYAASRELRVALSPSATALVTRRTLAQAKEAGVAMLHVSLDGSTPEIHDEFRGVRGSYQRTIEILGDAVDLDLPLQVGTTVNRRNLTDLPRLAEEVQRLGATVWSVFFLVPTGRGQAADMVSPAEHEEVFHLLAELSLRVPLHVRTTAAPAYRRVLAQHMSRVAPDAQEVHRRRLQRQQRCAIPGAGSQRRSRLLFRLPHRRCLPLRFSPHYRRERPPAEPDGALSGFAPLPFPARSHPTEGQVRTL